MCALRWQVPSKVHLDCAEPSWLPVVVRNARSAGRSKGLEISLREFGQAAARWVGGRAPLALLAENSQNAFY